MPKDTFLRDLTEVTGGGAIEIGAVDNLRSTFVTILQEFRQRYLLSYSPNGVPAEGWHPLTVRVKGGKYQVSARAGYLR